MHSASGHRTGAGWGGHTGARLPAVSVGATGPLEPGPYYTLFFTLTMLVGFQCNQLSVKIYFTDVFPCPGGQQLFVVRFASLHTAEGKAVVK